MARAIQLNHPHSLGFALSFEASIRQSRGEPNEALQAAEQAILAATLDILVREGYAAKDRVAAYGGSAGGLLMGAISNMAPDKYRLILSQVPFVDVVTTMLDPMIPLTTNEWEEWGNPDADPLVYRTMKSYSPYDNLRDDKYPTLYVTGGLNDSRVGFWEPTKWVQALRFRNPDNEVYLKMEMGAGHGGPSGRYDTWRDEAGTLAFIVDQIN